MTSEDDYDYQYSDEEGYSVEGDNDDMDWDSNENPNAPPVQYNTKIDDSLFALFGLFPSLTTCVCVLGFGIL